MRFGLRGALVSLGFVSMFAAGCGAEIGAEVPYPAADPGLVDRLAGEEVVLATDDATAAEGFVRDPNYKESDDTPLDIFQSALTATPATVAEAVASSCSTSVVRGLSEQLVAEIECIRPGTMVSIADYPLVNPSSVVLPYLQLPTADALRRASEAGGTLEVTSALRSLAQQYLLYRWYQTGRCGITLAASPGKSNHESGLAVDLSNYSQRRTAMEKNSFRWFGSTDPWHFDYTGGGTVNLSGLSVLALQRLWNVNHPEDPIAEDGAYGAQTRARLDRSPTNGFAKGATCAPPKPEVTLDVSWTRATSGKYTFNTAAPDHIVRVEYFIDGWPIGSAARAQDATFTATYTFTASRNERVLEVIGYDSADDPVGHGHGLLDVTAGTGVFIRSVGDHQYEIGLERAPAAVAAIEVSADNYLLADQLTDATRSTRLAVLYRFNSLGSRQFTLRTYNADGTLRGSLKRVFELK